MLRKNLNILFFTSKNYFSKSRIFSLIILGLALSLMFASLMAITEIQLDMMLTDSREKNTDIIYSIEPDILQNEHISSIGYSNFENITYISKIRDTISDLGNLKSISYGFLVNIRVINQTSLDSSVDVFFLVISDDLYNSSFKNEYFVNNSNYSSNEQTIIFNQQWLRNYGWLEISNLEFNIEMELNGELNNTLTFSEDIKIIGNCNTFNQNNEDDPTFNVKYSNNYPFFDKYSYSNLSPETYEQPFFNNKTIGVLSINYFDKLLKKDNFTWREYHELLLSENENEINWIEEIFIYNWVEDRYFYESIIKGIEYINNLDNKFLQKISLLDFPVTRLEIKMVKYFDESEFKNYEHLASLELQRNFSLTQVITLILPLFSIIMFLMLLLNRFTHNSDNILRLNLIHNAKSLLNYMMLIEWLSLSIFSFICFIFLHEVFLFNQSGELLLNSNIWIFTPYLFVILLLTAILWLYPTVKHVKSSRISTKPKIMNKQMNEKLEEERMLFQGQSFILKILIFSVISYIFGIYILESVNINFVDNSSLSNFMINNSELFFTFLMTLLVICLFFIVLLIISDYIFILIFNSIIQFVFNLKFFKKYRMISLFRNRLKTNPLFKNLIFIIAIICSFQIYFIVVPTLINMNMDSTFSEEFGTDYVIEIPNIPESNLTEYEIMNNLLINKLNENKELNHTLVYKTKGSMISSVLDIDLELLFIDTQSFSYLYNIQTDNRFIDENLDVLSENTDKILISKAFSEYFVLFENDILPIINNNQTETNFQIVDIFDFLEGFGFSKDSKYDNMCILSLDSLHLIQNENINSWICVKDSSKSSNLENTIQNFIPFQAVIYSQNSLDFYNIYLINQDYSFSFMRITAMMTSIFTILFLLLLIPIFTKRTSIDTILLRFLGLNKSEIRSLIIFDVFILGINALVIGYLNGIIFSILTYVYIFSNLFIIDYDFLVKMLPISIIILVIIMVSYFIILGISIYYYSNRVSLSKELKVDM